ncbi:BspA family leucine-rich repeat surface protein, partial [Mycoplasmopsis bovis]|uniref:BspA family leucine-rich repeat surface protein n=1 Tax=Mycoplasmopsis bovis TaxID=28903 RepID=UPI003D286CDB
VASLPLYLVSEKIGQTLPNGNEATSIGYDKEGKIEKFMPSTNKVPQHLPKFISSLSEAFEKSEQETIENLDKWDTSNIKYFIGVFRDATKFNHD